MQSRYGVDRGILEKTHATFQFPANLFPLPGIDTIPFIEQKNHRTAQFHGHTNEMGILFADPGSGIHDHQHHIGFAQGCKSLEHC